MTDPLLALVLDEDDLAARVTADLLEAWSEDAQRFREVARRAAHDHDLVLVMFCLATIIHALIESDPDAYRPLLRSILTELRTPLEVPNA